MTLGLLGPAPSGGGIALTGGAAGEVVTKAPDGSPVWAKPRASGNRVMGLGDSRFANGYASGESPAVEARNWLAIAAMLDSRINYAGIAATGGYTLAQIISDHLPTVLSRKPDVCVLIAGRNNVVNGVSQSTTFAQFRQVFEALMAAGIMPVAITEPAPYVSGNTDVQKTLASRINAFLRIYARDHGFPLVDLALTSTDPATNDWLAGDNADVSHPNVTGTKKWGAALAAALGPWLPPYSPLHPIAQTDPLTDPNMVANPLLLADANADGVPDGWTMSGSGTATTTLTAGTGSVHGNVWTIERTGGSSSRIGTSPTYTVVPGNVMEVAMRFGTEGVETAAGQVLARVVNAAGSVVYAGISQWKADNVIGLFTQRFTVPVGVVSVKLVVGVSSGVGTKVKIAQIGLYDLTALGAI